jgi:hypothetical protein
MDATPPASPSAEARFAEAFALKALGGVLLLLPLLLLPLIVLWFAGRGVLEEHSRLERYRSVPAVVLGATIERRPGKAAQSGPTYVPRVVYRYLVDGRAYLGQQVSPREVGGTEGWARRHAAEYHAGQRVSAYYDPAAPDRAFLDRRGMPALTATFFLPVPILAFAIVVAATARARRLARQRLRTRAEDQQPA